MISPGQLSMLAGCAHKSAGELGDQYPSVFIEEAACLADKIAAAMRTPITAEALTAAGWVEDYRTDQYGGVIVFRFESTDPNAPIRAWDVETGLDGSLKRIVDPRNFTVKSIRTMYALGQLVELLGGGK